MTYNKTIFISYTTKIQYIFYTVAYTWCVKNYINNLTAELVVPLFA